LPLYVVHWSLILLATLDFRYLGFEVTIGS